MNETVTTTEPTATKIEVANFVDKEPPEVVEAKALARRYRLPYIDLLPTDGESPIDFEELASIRSR
jgi:hypothetical protein